MYKPKMVFVAFLLIAVSTLAAHGREVSVDGPLVPRGCEGKTLCDVKPDDYPQEEIDNYLASNPAHVARMKRQAGLQGTKCEDMGQLTSMLDTTKGCNCQIRENCSKPYILTKQQSQYFPYVVVQSKFFEQNIRQVKCVAPGEPCFENLAPSEAHCEQKIVTTTIQAFHKVTKIVEEVLGEILVDCACVFKPY